jgi:hypothetical protein
MQTKNSAHPEPHLFLSAELPAGDWRQTRVMAFQGKYLSLKNQPEKRYETISMGDILSLMVVHLRRELGDRVRSWPSSTPYVLFYSVTAEYFIMVRILHHARDTRLVEMAH